MTHTKPAKGKRLIFSNSRFLPKRKQESLGSSVWGGSTTFGRPYRDRESYVGILRSVLQQHAPEREWEIINCGGISYASYRLAVLANELKSYDPDLFIVYTGHNEFLEERTYRDVRTRSETMKDAGQLLSYSRTASLFQRMFHSNEKRVDPLLKAEVDTILDHSLGPSDYKRDTSLRKHVVRQYRESLEQIVAYARSSGAKLIFIEPADNLRFSPFKSEHGDVSFGTVNQIDFALADAQTAMEEERFEDAVAQLISVRDLDPLYAETHYQLGRALLEAGKFDAAYDSFLRAREEDVCPLRAIEATHETLKELTTENHIPLISFPSVVAEYCRSSNGHSITGSEGFFDHVHPRTELHAKLAGELLEAIRDLGFLSPTDCETCQRNVTGTLDELLQILDTTDHAMALSNLSQVLSWAGKNEEAFLLSEEASKMVPDDVWIKCQYGRMLEKTGKANLAEQAYAEAVSIAPDDPLANFRLGTMFYRRQQYKEAYRLLKHSKAHTPKNAPSTFRQNLDNCLEACLSHIDDSS